MVHGVIFICFICFVFIGSLRFIDCFIYLPFSIFLFSKTASWREEFCGLLGVGFWGWRLEVGFWGGWEEKYEMGESGYGGGDGDGGFIFFFGGEVCGNDNGWGIELV